MFIGLFKVKAYGLSRLHVPEMYSSHSNQIKLMLHTIAVFYLKIEKG